MYVCMYVCMYVRWPAVIFSPVKIDNNPIFIETIGLVKEFPL